MRLSGDLVAFIGIAICLGYALGFAMGYVFTLAFSLLPWFVFWGLALLVIAQELRRFIRWKRRRSTP
jgi:hypothetical protein